jgi:RsiW-degrading membrane proteinase PrsW (M82 family)
MTTPPPTRTARLVGLRPPPSNSGRTAFLVSCAGLVVLTAMWGISCAGLNVLLAFAVDPCVAMTSMITAITCATPYFFVLRWLDRNDPEPVHIVISAFLWGAILATGLSIVVNEGFGAVAQAIVGDPALAEQLTASFSAPFIEELTKGLALVAIYLFFWRDFDNVLDGVLYGAFVGLGFAAFENFIYYSNTENVGEVVVLTMLRGVIIAIGLHPAFTGITGAGVGLFRVMRRGVLRWFIPPAALCLAMFAHFTWNTFSGVFTWDDQNGLAYLFVSMPIAVLFLQTPSLTMILLIAAIALRHERRMIEQYLASEEPPVVLPGEIARLVPARRRAWNEVVTFVLEGFGAWWITRRRNVRLVRLAFEKWHMDREEAGGDVAEGRAHALTVVALRKELEALQFPT